jgi:Cof subfamily protein (haloacid dehalogenase superfamily)
MAQSGRYRILALDIDGTLLDRDGILRPRTASAVARAAAAGIQPVLCTGRRYRRARPVAEQLGLDAPIVCNSGSIVKNPSDHGTLWRADFDAQLAIEVLALFIEHNQPCVAFADDSHDQPDFVASGYPTGRLEFDDYVEQNHQHARIDPTWIHQTKRGPVFHLFAVGSVSEMLAFEGIVLKRFGRRVQTFVQRTSRYLGTMCEVLRPEASKWGAVAQLATAWGIAAHEICAIGDDFNDVPMIRHAGFGVAMGHAPAEVLAVADHITGDHESEGVATFVENFLLN